MTHIIRFQKPRFFQQFASRNFVSSRICDKQLRCFPRISRCVRKISLLPNRSKCPVASASKACSRTGPMSNCVHKRQFWNLCRGRSIGFVESIYKGGVLIQTEFASFRETSSNLSNGEVREFSISKLPDYDRRLLENCLKTKTPIMVEWSKELIGSPFKGDVLECRYLDGVDELTNETINVTPNMDEMKRRRQNHGLSPALL